MEHARFHQHVSHCTASSNRQLFGAQYSRSSSSWPNPTFPASRIRWQQDATPTSWFWPKSHFQFIACKFCDLSKNRLFPKFPVIWLNFNFNFLFMWNEWMNAFQHDLISCYTSIFITITHSVSECIVSEHSTIEHYMNPSHCHTFYTYYRKYLWKFLHLHPTQIGA